MHCALLKSNNNIIETTDHVRAYIAQTTRVVVLLACVCRRRSVCNVQRTDVGGGGGDDATAKCFKIQCVITDLG